MVGCDAGDARAVELSKSDGGERRGEEGGVFIYPKADMSSANESRGSFLSVSLEK